MLPPPQWKLFSLYWPCPPTARLFLTSLSVAGRVFVPRRAPRKRSPEEKFGEGGPTKRSKHRKRKHRERKRESKRDSPRIFTTGPLINTHWVTGCLLCRNWALGALYPPFTIWTYPRNSLFGMARNCSLFSRTFLLPCLSLSFFLDARTFHELLQMMARSSFSSFCTRIEDVSCTKVH